MRRRSRSSPDRPRPPTAGSSNSAGKPRARVHVHPFQLLQLEGINGPAGAGQMVNTDDEGRFTILGLVIGARCKLFASNPDGGNSAEQTFAVKDTQPVDIGSIVLDPRCAVNRHRPPGSPGVFLRRTPAPCAGPGWRSLTRRRGGRGERRSRSMRGLSATSASPPGIRSYIKGSRRGRFMVLCVQRCRILLTPGHSCGQI